uniref:ATP synthase complex subunit 8 n=1 Tax=Thermobia domestica TaxID=89055 RepID=Q6DVL6_THEDO|nr:ATP synthase F0 subunit 8 [Thermobia domestica]AAT69283.1 ATP synthase F0 subunit 8 [Thermobia domestica]
MPQMSPLKWLILFIMFSLCYLLFASIMYFNSNTPDPSLSDTTIKKTTMNWKW